MRFNTHEKTPKEKAPPIAIVVLCITMVLVCGFVVLVSWAAVTSGQAELLFRFYAGLILVFSLAVVLFTDITRAYVEVRGEEITVVDYYFFIKREKHFKLSDLHSAAVWSRNTHWLRGYALKGIYYIEFRGEKNKYLFKVIACPETRTLFGKHVQITGLPEKGYP